MSLEGDSGKGGVPPPSNLLCGKLQASFYNFTFQPAGKKPLPVILSLEKLSLVTETSFCSSLRSLLT